jgi:hypothetical protein
MNADQHHAMADNNTADNNGADNNALDAAIVRSLEQPPEVAIPADFAARVRAALPTQAPRRRPASAGRIAAMVATAVSIVAVFALAAHAQPSFSSIHFDIELLLIAELAVILPWLTRSQRTL